MKPSTLLICLALGAGMAAAPALAAPMTAKSEKNHGKGHGNGNGPSEDHGRGHDDAAQHGKGHDDSGHHAGGRFNDHDRDLVVTYFRDETAAGRCPPGLAKKNNGCLPPGQAKKIWGRGEYVPAGYDIYDLPTPLYERLSPPPAGYRYVVVDGDVLLMEAATRLIVDLITGP